MDRKSVVLYQDLLQDLSRHLPSSILRDLDRDLAPQMWPDITPKQFACLALGKTFYKKFVDYVSPDADAQACKTFLAVNEAVGKWSLDLRATWEEEALGSVKRHLDNFFHPKGLPMVDSLTQLFELGRNGPGSSLGSVGQDDYTKLYSSDLTCTKPFLYRAYRSSLQGDPKLFNAEVVRYEQNGAPREVEGNVLAFVPKQRDTSRTICIEPTLNMYAQLGLASLMEKQLRWYFRIDLATQWEENRELAKRGSVDGSFGTIDLSSASDSMGLRMLKEVLPSNIFEVLTLLRSPKSSLPNGEQVELNMVSTMGNGFTFPLQTALFASVVSAAYDLHHLPLHETLTVKGKNGVKRRKVGRKNFGVFGDDICVDRKVYTTVCRILELLGFKVNAEKSFVEGPFRESCGGDYFSGHPVRGVYIKSLRTPQDLVVVLNRLHEWSADTGVFLPKTTARLYHWLRERLLRHSRGNPRGRMSVYRTFVPPWENMDAGLRVPFWCVENVRVDKDCQSVLYRAWRPKLRTMSLRNIKGLYAKGRIYNPYGMYLSFLRGYVNGWNMRISLRQRETTYVTKASVAPCWDTPRKVQVTDTWWQRWNTAVWFTVVG